MHDLLQKTGPYLHAPDDLSRLLFETGGTPRVFTLLIAAAVQTDRLDRTRDGIAILDEDEGRVLLDGHLRGDPAACAAEFYRIRAMGWPEFSELCRSSPRCRVAAADVRDVTGTPLPGSRRRQALLGGPRPLPFSERAHDLRSDLMISADSDPDAPFRFPKVTRETAIDALSRTPLTRGQDGLFRMSWPVRFPDSADLSGLSGPGPVDRSLDPAWTELVGHRPEILEEARLEAILPLLTGRVGTWGTQDEGRYDLTLSPSEEGVIVLSAFDGQPFGMREAREYGPRLAGLPIVQLRDLWKLKITLNHETSPDRVGALMGISLNRIRSETERSREPELQPSGP